MKIRVFVGAKDKPLFMEYRATQCSAHAIVVKAGGVIQAAICFRRFDEIVICVEVAVLEVTFAGSMPLIGAALSYQVELSARGVAVLGAELISDQAELGN